MKSSYAIPIVLAGAGLIGAALFLTKKKKPNFEEEEVLSVAGVGWNGFGQLGTGDVSFCEKATVLKNVFYEASQIRCGGLHYSGFSLVLTESGDVYAFGENSNQQLPFPEKHLLNPTKCGFERKVRAVACGSMNTLFVFEDGSVASYGDNTFGQLGREKEEMVVFGNSDTKIVDVACGDAHCLFVSSTGELYGCGSNKLGQLGEERVGENINSPLLIKLEKNGRVQQVAAGQCHSLVLLEEGEVLAFGCNTHSQIGVAGEYRISKPNLIQFPEPIKTVSAGSFHNVCLSRSGICYTWGSNEYGQLGQPNNVIICSVSPMAISKQEFQFAIAGSLNTFVIDKNGVCFSCGCNSECQCGVGQDVVMNGTLMKIEIPNKVVKVDASDSHTLFLVND